MARRRIKVFVRGNDFHENSELSSLAKQLPKEIDQIAWIDDIIFTNSYWQQEASELLDRCDICQLYESVYTSNIGRLSHKNHSLAFGHVNKQFNPDFEYGYGWAARREVVENGLVDNIYMVQNLFKLRFDMQLPEVARQWILKTKIKGVGCVRGSIIIQEKNYTPPKLTTKNPANTKYACDVIIPFCQNNIRWVKMAVESILNQSNSDPVIHLIADGFEMPNDFYFFPANLYQNKDKIGPYRSTNAIVPYLETDYIAIQDSDDIALPHRLAHSLNSMQGYDMYGGSMRQFCSYETIDIDAENYVLKNPIHFSGEHGWSISPYGVVINGARCMTKDLFVSMNGFADLFMSGDCEFTTRCYKYGVKIVTDSEIVALRRVHGMSLSRGKEFGLQSDIRDEIHNQIHESYELMPEKPAADFGCLGKYETQKL